MSTPHQRATQSLGLIYMCQVTWASDSRRPRHPQPSMMKNSSPSRAPKNPLAPKIRVPNMTARYKAVVLFSFQGKVASETKKSRT